MISARPKKLRNGSWGAFVEHGQVKEDEEVTITTKSGKSWTAKVSKVIWSGPGGTIVATVSKGHVGSGKNGRYHGGRRRRDFGSKRCCQICGATAHLLQANFGLACSNHYDDLS